MELKIVKEYENLLFNRKEIEATMSANSIPSKKSIEEVLSKKFSIHPENIAIKKIGARYGSNGFKIIASIYNSKEDKEKTEVRAKKQIKPVEEKKGE